MLSLTPSYSCTFSPKSRVIRHLTRSSQSLPICTVVWARLITRSHSRRGSNAIASWFEAKIRCGSATIIRPDARHGEVGSDIVGRINSDISSSLPPSLRPEDRKAAGKGWEHPNHISHGQKYLSIYSRIGWPYAQDIGKHWP